MGSIRVKVLSHAPLPGVRVWYEVPTDIAKSSTVFNLKADLCRDIPPFVDENLAPNDICLEVDGFELLDGSLVSVIQNDDILSVKARSSGPKQRTKRRQYVEAIELPIKRRKIQVDAGHDSSASGRLIPPTDSSSSSSESEGETVSSNESSANGDPAPVPDDESSDASSESSETSSQVPELDEDPIVIKPLVHAERSLDSLRAPDPTRLQILQPSLSTYPVLPGQGKPSTHARNARRRKRKSLLKSGPIVEGAPKSTTEAPQPVDSTEWEQLPSALPYDTPSPTDAVPATSPVPALDLAAHLSNKNKRKGFKKAMEGKGPQKMVFDSPRRPRFIPPSEKNDIPSNMFVTSVDCATRGLVAAEAVRAHPSGASVTTVTPQSMWENMAQAWGTLKVVSSLAEIKEGQIVAWKALALNQRTYSPEVLLHMGTVLGVSPLEDTCRIVSIPRPDEMRDGADEGDDDSMPQLSEETFDLAAISHAGWVLVE